MPTADLDAVLDVLPVWVRIGAWVLVPLLLGLASWLAIWLCARCTRVGGDGLPWTEFAKRRHEARIVLNAQVALGVVCTAMLTAQFGEELGPGWAAARALLAGSVLWLATRRIAWKHGFRTHLGWSRSDFWQSTRLTLVTLAGPLLAVAMAVAGPSIDEVGVYGCIAFCCVGSGLVAWTMLHGLVRFTRWLGLAVPADARLRALVAAVEQRTGHVVRATWILRTRSANAFAMPWQNELAVTSGALECLTEPELTAILLHEFGHLRESRRDQWLRCLVVLPWLVLASWQPLASGSGRLVPVVLLFATLALVARIKRGLHRLEVAADGHANEHLGAAGAGDYARALERLHRANLAPAVLPGKNRTHPDLYDRMLAARVTPDFPRPAPPRPKLVHLVAFTSLTVASILAPVFASLQFRFEAHTSEASAKVDVMFAGDHRSIAKLGYHWLAERPADAAVLFAYATARSKAPEHAAWLAMALAERDASAARAALEHAEQLLATGRVEKWQRETVAAARERLRRAAPGEGR